MLYKGEIRHILIISSLVLLLLFICIASQLYLEASCQELIDALEKVNGREDLENFNKEFDRITDIWLMLLPHGEIDRLSEAYYLMYSCPDDAFEQQRQALLNFLILIPERMRLSFQNVL